MVVTVITTPPPPKPLIYLSHIYLLSAIYVPGGLDGKESACNAEDLGLILGLGRSLGEGNGNPLQYSCLENPVDRGAWWATVHGVAKSWTHRVPNTFTLIQPLEWTTSLYPHSQVIQPRAPNDHLHTGF